MRKVPEGVGVERFTKSLALVFERVLWGEPIRGPDRGGRQHRSSLRRLLPGDGGRVYALGYLASYTDPSLDSVEREVTRADAITTIVKAVDEYLIAAILLLFALGLYELFIDRIDAAED